MKNSDYEKRTLTGFIGLIISAFKWISLIFFVFSIGLAIGLAVMVFIHGNNLPDNIVANMIELMTYYPHGEILQFIESVGKEKVLLAGFASGIAYTLNYGLLYLVTSKLKMVFSFIKEGNMFQKKSIQLTKELLPLSLILTFVQPVILYCAHHETSMFELNDINVSGILFLIIAYVLKLIFERGYALQTENEQLQKKIIEHNDIEEENKINELTKEISTLKKTTGKKTKTTKKESKTTK